MAYNQERLEKYREDARLGKPFTCPTCPYCNGERDAAVKYTHFSTKPASPWDFWRHVLVRKYRALQSMKAKENLDSGRADRRCVATATAGPPPPPPCGTSNDCEVETSEGDSKMFVVGPMVDQSELPFRMLCRSYGATLAYTPMLHAKSFKESATYRRRFFSTTPVDELTQLAAAASGANPVATDYPKRQKNKSIRGAVPTLPLVDRPCIVQFCGHDADTILEAARFAVRGEYLNSKDPTAIRGCPQAPSSNGIKGSGVAEGAEEFYYQCDAVDLNLGCPQGIARRGHYGSFLMEDWDCVHTIIHTLHVELEVPVTAKIRVFDLPATPSNALCTDDAVVSFDEPLTIYYAQMIRDAGAQLLCVHGRTRSMKGQQSGLASLELIRRVRLALGGSIPVLSNGNVRCYEDVLQNLAQTGCEGHMCAEPLLWDPSLFSNPSSPVSPGRLFGADKRTRIAALHTALDYVRWLRRCPVDLGFAKAHLFKMCYHSYELHPRLREFMGGLKTGPTPEPSDVRGKCDPEATSAIQGQSESLGQRGMERVTDHFEFSRQVDAIETHLYEAIRVELACTVEGEQPKAAKVAKAETRALKVDILEEDDFGIDFL